MSETMGECKSGGAEDKGNNNPPSSQKAIKNSPKENFLCDRRDDPAHEEKEEKTC